MAVPRTKPRQRACAVRLLAALMLLISAAGVGSTPSRAQTGNCQPGPTNAVDQKSAAPLTAPGCYAIQVAAAGQTIFSWSLAGAQAAHRWSFHVTPIDGQAVKIGFYKDPKDLTVTPQQLGEIDGGDPGNGIDTDPLMFAPGAYFVGIATSGPGSYSFTVTDEGALPKSGDKEPNDSQDTATPLKAQFSLSGNRQGSDDWYAWTLSKTDATKHWSVSLQAPMGDNATVSLIDAKGAVMDNFGVDPIGRVAISGLGLDAGTYFLELGQSDQNAPYLLTSTMGSDRSPDTEDEPNGGVSTANAFDPANSIYGVISDPGDVDYFRFHVDKTLAASIFDITLMASPGLDRKLCLVDSDGGDITCKDDKTGLIALSGLSLPEGDHYFRVAGDVSLTDQYSVDLLVTGKVEPGTETLPNDTVANANLINQSNQIKGKFGPGGGDYHFFKLRTTGDPQLWQIEATGGGITSLRIADSNGNTLAVGTISSDGTYAVLTDQFFTPGDHWIVVVGANGDFAVAATPTGPPDPNGEREPNDNLATSEILAMGQPRTGRMTSIQDTDVYRFNLAAAVHVILKVQSPADGIVATRIQWYDTTIQAGTPANAGGLETFDLMLKPGDYSVWLSAPTPSDLKYQLSVDRADPFIVADDQEPNNSFNSANPLPPSLVLTGMVGEFGDQDWYRIPPLAAGSDLVMTYSSTDIRVRIFDAAGNEIPVQVAADNLSGEAQLPADTPLGIEVSGASAAYKIALAFTPGPKPATVPKPNVDVKLALDATQVAAFWESGQSIKGTVTLTTTGFLPQTVQLAAATSHFGWSVDFDKTQVLVTPGGSGATVPVTVTVQPDAWANIPVRITVRALSANGAISTGFVEVTPGPDSQPANPIFTWPLPKALLGGLDVASLALGAKVVPSVDETSESELHDGLATSGGGFHLSSATLPLTLTVQLAGNDGDPVAGVILDPLNNETPVGWVKDFTLMLSMDGVNYEEALSGTLQSLPLEQAFVLPKPVKAKFAQLVILSNADPSGYSKDVSLGEWKVVATPGFAPSGDPIDIADPVNGGHIVNMNPQYPDPQTASALLDADPGSHTINVKAGTKPFMVIGFDEERAAQIARLEWSDPTGSTPDQRFTKMTIEISTAGPLGPWTKVGLWNLKRAGDGSVSPFTFDKPVWARFVRLTGNGPTQDGTWEYPGQIRVIEAPTSAVDFSVTGQWGYGNPAGPYELVSPPAPKTLPPLQANTTKAAAQPLAANTKATGQIQIGKTVAWYTVTAPGNQNTLTFTVTGDPVADATVQVFDASGQPVPVKLLAQKSAAASTFEATVKPGQTYNVEVTQPPHSIVFAFDTSTSISAYEDMVKQSLKAFAADVTPGQEFVNVMPFSEDFLLKTWSDQPYEIETALSQYADTSLSSSSEQTMIAAMAGLQSQPGAKAILLLTDGETSSYGLMSQMWPMFTSVDPRIFAVHVGSGGDGGISRHLMQDWAAANNGFYQYTTNQGEMDRAFDRLATWMRRPVGFTISYATSQTKAAAPTPVATATPAAPGSLAITMTAQSSNAPQPANQVSTDVAVEIILDTSGSMLQEIEPGKSRIDVARATLVDLVSNKLPAGVPVALRTFADDPGSCDTILRSPLAPLDPGAMASTIENVGVTNLVKTPIGAALDQVATDLAGVKGPKIVVLVTDGEETCGGDPEASIKHLVSQGFQVQVNIVGFALDNDQLKAQFEAWAKTGNGSYYDATDSASLNAGVDKALAPPFQVFDASGKLVASGQVGAAAVNLPAGRYKVVILSNPNRTFKTVTISPGKKTTLKLEDGAPG